jgi:DNA-binding transcriptional LysR family regulator
MIDELRHFLLIAEHRTFTEAARRAHLSQPALTASMRRLEDELGARLFHRGRAGAELTAAGSALLPRARAALAAIEEGKRAVAEVTGVRAGEVRIGAGGTACTYLLPPVLAAFRRQHPVIRFQLREALTDQLETALLDGELDLAVMTVSDRPFAGPWDRWRDDELIAVAAPGVDPRSAKWVTFTNGWTTRTVLFDHVPRADVVMELGSIAAVKGNVRAGIGLALVSRSAVTSDLARGALVEVALPWTPVIRPLALRHHGVSRLSPAAAALREMLLADAASLPKVAPRPRRRVRATRRSRS